MNNFIFQIKLLFSASFLLLSDTALSQSGYMGKRNVVDIRLQAGTARSLKLNSLPVTSLGARFEIATSDVKGLGFGFSGGITAMSEDAVSFYSRKVPYVIDYDHSGPTSYYGEGTMYYGFCDFYFQDKYYLPSWGGIAPYGFYIGYQIDFSLMKLGPEESIFPAGLKPPGAPEELPELQNMLSASFIIGAQRVINSDLTLGFHLSAGTPLKQSTATTLVNKDGLNNIMDVQEHMMARHFAISKRLQFGCSLGWIF